MRPRPAVVYRLLCLVLVAGFLLLGLPPRAGHAQPAAFSVRSWTVQDGLPTNNVKDVAYDADGFLWIATNDGLVRFDGHRMRVVNRSTTPELPTNDFDALYATPDGVLWAASGGRYFVAREAGRWRTYPTTTERLPREVLLVETGRLWLGTAHGLVYSDDGQFTAYRPEVIGDTPVTAAVRAPDSSLWVATGTRGLFRFAPDGSVRRWTTADGLPADNVRALHRRPDGTLWVLTTHGLVALRDGFVQAEAVYDTPRWRPEIEWTTSYLVGAPDGRLWINTYNGGVWLLDGERLTLWHAGSGVRRLYGTAAGDAWIAVPGAAGQPTRLHRNGAAVGSVPGFVKQIRAGRDGLVWVITGAGLHQLRPSVIEPLATTRSATPSATYAVIELPEGGLWVANTSEWGVAYLAPDGALRRPLNPPRPARTITRTSDGTLWLGGHLCRVEGATCRDVHAGPQQVPVRQVNAMYEDRAGRFWVSAGNILWQGRADQPPATWRAHTVSEILHDKVQVFYETAAGALLMGTDGSGLLRLLDSAGGTLRFERLGAADGLASDHVRDVYEDHEGLLWIATEDRGLCRLDRRGGVSLTGGDLRCLGVDDGLYSASLHRLLEDRFGRFWINANQGIFWVRRSDLEAWARGEVTAVSAVAYTDADGMPDREGNGGMQNAGLRTRDGRLLFPTMDGLAVVDPAAVPLPTAPTPFVEAVAVEGRTRTVAETLRMEAAERDVTFSFTAPEFVKPDNVRFQYRLRGYQATWRTTQEHRATFTNLPPGDYTFEVRAGLGGAWSAPAALAVRRAAFWWETRTFWAAVLLAALGLGWAYLRRRFRRAHEREQRLQQEVALRTTELQTRAAELEVKNARIAEQAEELGRAAELKARFLTNITHEFRTPLTLTFGPIDRVLGGEVKSLSAARPHLEMARRNGSRLLRLINQLLDLAQLGAGAMTLQAERADLAATLRQTAAPFASLAEVQQVMLTLRLPDAPLPFAFDRDKVEKIVVNLLSNAFKFTPPGGTITLGLRETVEGVVIEVADTGTGIAADHLPHLFERFYQVDDGRTRAHEGSGVGLALVKELAELHGGDVAVASTPGEGTRFIVRLAALPEAEVPRAPEAAPEEPSAVEAAAVAAPVPSGAGDEAAAPGPRPDALVLIVEDNADMRAYLRSHLAPHFQVAEAVDGHDGLALAEELVPDLVLTDVMMPRMDGVALCAALKAARGTSHVPVLMLSARADVASRIAGYDTGADAYLAKPFDAAELLARVRSLLAERARLWAAFREAPPSGAGSIEGTAEREASETPPELPPCEAAFLADLDAAVEAHMSDTDFTTERLAEVSGVSRRQLQRKLKALTGEAPGERLRRVRLERAAELLRAEGRSVKETAFAVGFQSESAFGRAFRQRFGETPSAYASNSHSVADAPAGAC